MKIAVAYVRGPRGFKGELAAILYKPSSRSLEPGLEVTIRNGDLTEAFKIEYLKSLRKGIGIKLAGIEDELTAVNWKGGEILIDAEKLKPLDEKEFYHFQIEGAEVFEIKGERIGIVRQVDNSSGNTLLIVDTGSEEIMIPFVEAFVKSVDIENKKIVVEKIEGLI